MSDRFETSAGPYVLGALSPAERAEFADHLTDCAACREQVEELAGLPGLLGRVPLTAVLALEDEPSTDRTTSQASLAALLAAARRERARRRFRVGALAVAACFLAAAALAGVARGGALHPSASASPPPPASSASSSAPPSGTAGGVHQMLAVASVPITATVELEQADWGTQVLLQCSYDTRRASPTAGTTGTSGTTGDETGAADGVPYTLVVVGPGGARQSIGTWTSHPGREVKLAGASSWARSSITKVEVLPGGSTTTGSALLTLDART